MKRISGLKLAVAAVLVAGALSPLNALAANAKFIVKDSAGTNNVFTVNDDGSFVSRGATISAADNGFVTFQNSSPGGAGSTSALQIIGKRQTASQIKVMAVDDGAGANGGGGIMLGHNNVTSNGSLPMVGDRIGYFQMGTTDPVVSANRWGGGFVATAAANWSVDYTNPASPVVHLPTKFEFKTAGATGPFTTKLAVTPEGGLQLSPNSAAKPNCDSTDGPANRGVVWFTNGGAAKDSLQVCAFDGSAYGWRTLY